MMKIIQLTKNDVHQGSLMLVNRQHAIRSQLKQNPKAFLPIDEKQDIYLISHAGTMLFQLIKTCKAGDEILPISGYRSFREQQDLYDSSLKENGEEFTLKYVAYPGCSEHQTGLAVDVARKSESIDFICPDFPYSGICQQFRAKASEFGFIERYQEGKETITGISQEPWHFRYVGHPHAKIMETNFLALEEYIQLLRTHPHGRNPLVFQEQRQTIEISFIDLTNCQDVTVQIPDELHQISGNNVDGVILTVWRQPA